MPFIAKIRVLRVLYYVLLGEGRCSCRWCYENKPNFFCGVFYLGFVNRMDAYDIILEKR
jgi:hypothetical protein